MPKPKTVSRPGAPASMALRCINANALCLFLFFRSKHAYFAAIIGAAIDVPVCRIVLFGGNAVSTDTPSAAKSTYSP